MYIEKRRFTHLVLRILNSCMSFFSRVHPLFYALELIKLFSNFMKMQLVGLYTTKSDTLRKGGSPYQKGEYFLRKGVEFEVKRADFFQYSKGSIFLTQRCFGRIWQACQCDIHIGNFCWVLFIALNLKISYSLMILIVILKHNQNLVLDISNLI